MEQKEKNVKEKEKSFINSKVLLENREKLSISGVEKVFETNENRVQLKVAGTNLCISGENLQVNKLSVEMGEIDLNGIINEIKYTNVGQKGSFLKKIFK